MVRLNRNTRLDSTRRRVAAIRAWSDRPAPISPPPPGPGSLRAIHLRRLASLLLLLALAPLAGCANFVSPLSQWRAAYDGNLFKHLSPEEMNDVSGSTDSNNMFQRWLTPRSGSSRQEDSTGSTQTLDLDGWRPIARRMPDPAADAELDAAITLFQKGDFETAEKQFARIAKNRKHTTWGEDAQYYVGECQFQRKKYVQAHDSFELLARDYPATNYKDKLVRREYELGQIWLAQSDPKAPADKKLPWYARFDGRLPIIDSQGTGLSALTHVRNNMPDGPLADKAAFEQASFYKEHLQYEEAAMYFEEFVKEYPKSQYLQTAQLEGIDARIKSYMGPDYDSHGLEKARALIKQTMATFPERQESVEKLYGTLDHINNAQAEKTYQTGMYYKKTGKVASAEYYLGKIPQRWPNSPWAVKAKTELALLAKMPRKPSRPSKIIIPPGATDPFMSAGPMGGMMGGMGMGMPGMGMGMPGGMM